MPPKNRPKSLNKEEEESIPSFGYQKFLEDIKARIQTSQLRATIQANSELIMLYWNIGEDIAKKQEREGWGAKTVEKLAKDLSTTFPNIKGFSKRNLHFMVQFAREYSDIKIVKQVVSQIPWGHNILILQKLNNLEERLWYTHKTIENGWSRSVLLHWIDSNLFQRQRRAIINFHSTLPKPQSDFAHESLKDPYLFDFLTLREEFDERELEEGLLDHIQKFLLELGTGFAFVGRQVLLKVDDQDFYVDLLFYHLKLRCFVVVELKVTEFKPEYAGKMNFYLTAVDEILKHPDDKPAIGLLLCKTKSNLIVEYALRDTRKPIGVAEYEAKLVESLPKNLKGSLPTIEEIENELSN